MPNVKNHPRYHVISIRVTDGEKAALFEMTRQSNKNVAMLMREALRLYTIQAAAAINRG